MTDQVTDEMAEQTASPSPLTLTEAEAKALVWALDNYLPELAFELARVERERDRHEVGARETLLKALRERLARPRPLEPAGPGPATIETGQNVTSG